MNEQQILAIKCAYADLVGALEAYLRGTMEDHDWEAHADTIQDLEKSFCFIEHIAIIANNGDIINP